MGYSFSGNKNYDHIHWGGFLSFTLIKESKSDWKFRRLFVSCSFAKEAVC